MSVGRWLQLLPQRRAKAIRALKRVCIPAGAGASHLAILCRAFAYAARGRAFKRSATSPSGDVFVGSTGLTMRAERPSPPARNDTTRAHVSQRRHLAANAPPLRSCTATVPIASAAEATLPKGSLVAALRHRPRRSTAAKLGQRRPSVKPVMAAAVDRVVWVLASTRYRLPNTCDRAIVSPHGRPTTGPSVR
jgi:hypothetical protein